MRIGLSVWVFAQDGADHSATYGVIGIAAFSLAAGVLFVLPVGGADVPIVISLLNAFTGLTVAASGYVLGNVLLLVAGTLVGASGTILTRLMAQAMGRPITSHAFRRAARRLERRVELAVGDRPVRSASPDDVAILLGYARRSSSSPGTASRSRRPSTRCASSPTCCRRTASRSSTASTPSPAGCPVT